MTLRSLLLLGLTLVLSGSASQRAVYAQSEGETAQVPRVLLRMARDSAVVGHYRYTVQERQQLTFDIPADDPRVALLESVTVPKQKTTAIAATIVSTPSDAEAERRYVAYWLGYRITGDDVRGLSAVQWDSIFQAAGRRGIVRFSPRGQVKGVEVGSDAVRPVGQALANALLGLAMALPADSVTEGSSWEGRVAVTLEAPNGSRLVATVQLGFRLREFQQGADGPIARIEFDGEPLAADTDGPKITGRYYGESYFSVERGRYDRIMARADLEVEWKDTSGLPPSRLIVQWEAQKVRG